MAEEIEAGDTVQVPSTPPPANKDAAQKATHAPSTPPAGSMTPPPSTQPRRIHSPSARNNAQASELTLSSPLATKFNIQSILPTTDKIANATIEELRTMARDLITAVTDARMSAAHFKLQHTLLIMETHEAAQRAEVEQQMAKREVEAVQAAEQRHRAVSTTPRLQQSPQPQIAALTKTCKELEDERDEAEEQLQQTKRYLEFEKGRSEVLAEENILLKKRIRENREHFTKLRDHSSIYATPRQPYTTPRRKSYSRFTDNTPAHDKFAALLYADQMLSQETTSVPSTPTKSQPARIRQGHIRGAHSLSSLQTTPGRRLASLDDFPTSYTVGRDCRTERRAESGRHDRDSTISISDAEDEISGEEVNQSQASSLATDMLRRHPASQESMRQSQDAERSSSLLQSKLLGKVSKSTGKRSRKEDFISSKKAKLNDGVGLGVAVERW